MKTAEKQVGKILEDKSATGRERPWGRHKLMNLLLAMAYDEVDKKKAARLRDCATLLGFMPTEDGQKRLREANFCRVRLCPMCMWRRSLKIQAQMHQILLEIAKGKQKYAYVYVTLTVKNCKPDELESSLDKLFRGWQRLIQSKEVKEATHGFYRAVEVTHNVDPASKDFDTFHPHIHALFAVNVSYFKNDKYIKHERWMELWKRSMRLSYDPAVDVRRVKGNTAKAVAEAAGYSVKSSHYILPDDWDLTVDTVRLLDKVLENRRFVSLGGLFLEYQRRLKLDDAENGNLVHIDGDEPSDVEDRGKWVYYAWHSGYKQYRECSV
jgi:plasmid rolling circle replication initiator protein Rep